MKNTSGRQKKIVLAAVLGLGIMLCAAVLIIAPRFGNLSITLPVEQKPIYEDSTQSNLPALTVNGNHIVDANGNEVILRGLMLPDPAVLNSRGLFKQEFFDRIATSGANVIRIPVHPERWERDPDYLWRYLDPIVRWNADHGIYTLIDLHFIGNIESGGGSQMPDITAPSKEFAVHFWQQIAGYFKGTPNVLFEIVNEPTEISPADWQSSAQDLVGVIRATGAQQVIIVGGVEYSRDLSWVLSTPVNDDNLAYAAHIYPAHSSQTWDHWFGNVSEKYPVLLTEWGWMETDPGGEQPYLVGTQRSYGEPLLRYLEQHKIGWVACWYDTDWKPNMFVDDFEHPTPFGSFVLDALTKIKR